jgi:hypothetical protein
MTKANIPSDQLKYADGLPLGVIGLVNFTEITSLQINVPSAMGTRTKYEAVLRDKDHSIIVSIEHPDYPTLRSALANLAHIGLKYTDAVLAQTVDFNARFLAAQKNNLQNEIVNQFHTEYVTYSVIRHPGQIIVNMDPKKDRVETAFFMVTAQQRHCEDPDECLIFQESVDSLFDAVVVIRNDVEKSIIRAFMPEIHV